jgi:hypothetical protein
MEAVAGRLGEILAAHRDLVNCGEAMSKEQLLNRNADLMFDLFKLHVGLRLLLKADAEVLKPSTTTDSRVKHGVVPDATRVDP